MLMLGGPEKGAGKSSRPPTLNAKKTDGDAPTPRGGSSGARDPEVGSSGGGPSARPSWERGAGFCTLLLFVLWFLHRFGAATLRHFEPEALRDTFEAAGEVGGVALYVAAFAVGELLHVPAALFVAAGVLVWGCGCAHSGTRGWRQPDADALATPPQSHARLAPGRLRSAGGAHKPFSPGASHYASRTHHRAGVLSLTLATLAHPHAPWCCPR